MHLKLLLPPSPAAPPRRWRRCALCQVHPGRRVQVLAVELESPARRPLETLGLIGGRHLEVVFNDHRGTLAVTLDGRDIILGRRQTYRIQVQGLMG